MDSESQELDIVQQAISWKEGDNDELEAIVYDIANVFDNDLEEETPFMRAACEELLVRERLPAFHRAQLLVYMACTEDDKARGKIRERIEDAQYWINDVEQVMMLETGLRHPRIDQLQRSITEMRQILNEQEGEVEELPPVSETITGRTGFMPASQYGPAERGRELTADEKYQMIKNAKQFEADVKAMEGETEKSNMAPGQLTVPKPSLTRSEDSKRDSGGKYRGASMAGAQPLSLTSSAQSTSAQPPPRPRGSIGISHPTPSVAVSGVSAVAQPPAPSATGAITGGLAVPLTGTTEMPIRTGSTEGEQSDVGKKGQAGKGSTRKTGGTMPRSLRLKKSVATLGGLVEPGKPIASLKKQRSKAHIGDLFKTGEDDDKKSKDDGEANGGKKDGEEASKYAVESRVHGPPN